MYRRFSNLVVVNAENSSLKAPKFSKPNDRAHHALFDDLLEEFGSKGKKSQSDDESPASPLRKMFSNHLSIGKKGRSNLNGSLNDLSSGSPTFSKNSSPISLGPSTKFQTGPGTSSSAESPRTPFKPEISSPTQDSNFISSQELGSSLTKIK